MTPEELLKPRYKVIADYPLSGCKIGQIIKVHNEGDFVPVIQGGAWRTDISQYPHLFKRLEWWEERKESDMPEYVKGLKSFRRLLKVEFHTDEYPSFLCEGDSVWSPAWLFLPATKEEYAR